MVAVTNLNTIVMKKIIPILVIVLFFAFCNQAPKKVMLVFSYHPEYEWVVEETQGVMDALAGKDIVYEKFYMNTKQNTNEEWMTDISAKAISKIDEFQPDVLMVFDDNACKYVGEHYNGTDQNVVFCGMNGDPSDYSFPSDNITGVVERELWHESYDLITQLKPGVENAVILMDSSSTSAMTKKRIASSPLMEDLLGVYRIATFDNWKETVLNLQDSVDAVGLFVYFAIKDNVGNQVPAEKILSWTLENSSLPEFAILDFTVINGALCGVIETGHTQGKLAAEIVAQILDGKSPAGIPVVTPHKGEKLINRKRADQLGISLDESILKDSKILE